MKRSIFPIFLSLLCLLGPISAVQAQYKAGAYDSVFIPAKNRPQQNEFLNNTYNFPAKPRNMWEAGASLGMLAVSGDVSTVLPTFGFEAHVRKSLGYKFSLRLQYMNGTAKGLSWQPSAVTLKNPAWLDASVPALAVGNLPNGKGYNAFYRDNLGNFSTLSPTLNGGVPQMIYHNYKTQIQDLSLQGIITLNNVRFHKQQSKFLLYGGGGIGISAYHVMVNALDANGNNYTSLFNSIINSGTGGLDANLSDKKSIFSRLKAGMDNTYETHGQSESDRRGSMGKNTIRPSGTVLLGVTYRLGKRINLSLENRHTFVKTDLLDGQQWQVHAKGDVVLTRDFDSYNFTSLGINVNLGAKSVEPLWWLNPLDYAYSELNNPRHMKLPKPVFEDIDGDGVIDQLDREPNTPSGCPVDLHGVTKDTDGDGVPDCKDKQLITPSDCQPVDADGVGKCPEVPCCAELQKSATGVGAAGGNNAGCPVDYPSLRMNKTAISAENKALIASVVSKLKANPTCSITLTGYPKADKRNQALTNRKLDMIKNYLIEHEGISADRITTNTVIDGGDEQTIDIR